MIQLSKNATDRQVREIDRELEASRRRTETLKILAAGRNKDAADSIILEEKRARELEKKRERRIRRAKRQEALLAGLKILSIKAGSGDKNAVGNTIKDIGLLQAGLASLGGFKEGTDFVDGKTNTVDLKTKDDRYLTRLDHGERVITAKDNKLIGSMSNKELVQMSQMYKDGIVGNASIKPIQATTGTLNVKAIVDSNREVKEAINKLSRDFPIQEWDYNKHSNILKHTISRGGDRRVTKQKLRGVK